MIAMSCGSSTKVSFTLPISCQICLEKVKEPVLCPNQHVFCMTCMDAWLECHRQCPTCRIDITPQSPIRRIIGNQNECHNSPKFSREIRKVRMERLWKEYEDDIQTLLSEVDSLKSSNERLKTQLENNPGGSKCARCHGVDDLDDMLEKTKHLQAMTKTFDKVKEDCNELKEKNENLQKENDILRRKNEKIKLEIQTRSPMKFGRLTVMTLESRLQEYEKQVKQLQKALETNDSHNETLRKQLEACICGSADIKKDIDTETNSAFLAENTKYNSASRKLNLELDISPTTGESGTNLNSKDQAIGHCHISSELYMSPFTPSNKFSQLHIRTPTDPNDILQHIADSSGRDSSQDSGISTGHSSQEDLSEQTDCEAKVRSFSAQQMPAMESPDYKHKLQQIQGNLLQPITSVESSATQSRTFSRRLTFEEGNVPIRKNEAEFYQTGTVLDENQVDLSSFLNLDETSNISEIMVLQSEDSQMSVASNNDSQEPVFEAYIETTSQTGEIQSGRSSVTDESHFAVPQGPVTLYRELKSDLNESSKNPILHNVLTSDTTNKLHKSSDPVMIMTDKSKSVMDVCGARITTTKLSQRERDLFARPSSAPSRTFLLSGSRFSALRPLDPPSTEPSENCGFQPVKCKSPSPMSMRRQFTKPNSISIPGTGTEVTVTDNRAPSPLLRLVSPDEVINSRWKQSTSNFSVPQSHTIITQASPRQATSNKSSDKLSRVTILKRKSSVGKSPQSHTIGGESSNSPGPIDENFASSTRRSSRKQRLTMRGDLRSKREGEQQLDFISPIKSTKFN